MDWMNLLRSRVASWPTATPSTWYSSTFHEKRFLLTMWAQVCRDEWAKRALGRVMIRPTRTVLKRVYEVDSWSSSAVNPFLPTTAATAFFVQNVNGRTYGWTDKPTYRDARTHLKSSLWWLYNYSTTICDWLRATASKSLSFFFYRLLYLFRCDYASSCLYFQISKMEDLDKRNCSNDINNATKSDDEEIASYVPPRVLGILLLLLLLWHWKQANFDRS